MPRTREPAYLGTPLRLQATRCAQGAHTDATETCKGDTLFPRARAGGPMEHKNLLVLNTK